MQGLHRAHGDEAVVKVIEAMEAYYEDKIMKGKIYAQHQAYLDAAKDRMMKGETKERRVQVLISKVARPLRNLMLKNILIRFLENRTMK